MNPVPDRSRGSPPLARGPVLRAPPSPDSDRITPARAGTGWRPFLSPWRAMDHPRSRGDRAVQALVEVPHHGSPPLARGPVGDGQPSGARFRITPARAGTGTHRRGTCNARPDHPRSRGDRKVKAIGAAAVAGSPPLARGPAPLGCLAPAEVRITPARAGTGAWSPPPSWTPTDHPRSRGDRVLAVEEPAQRAGSPPLARGPERLSGAAWTLGRITPARAGTGTRRPPAPWPEADHPRSRGDRPGRHDR